MGCLNVRIPRGARLSEGETLKKWTPANPQTLAFKAQELGTFINSLSKADVLLTDGGGHQQWNFELADPRAHIDQVCL